MAEDVISLAIFSGIALLLMISSIIAIKHKMNYFAIFATVILWGLLPWPFLYLVTEIDSVLTITFLRILIAIIGMSLFIIVSLILNIYYKKKKPMSRFQYSSHDFKKQMFGYLPATSSKQNMHKKAFKMPYLLYYFLLGAFYFISILFFFISYQKLGVIFTAILNAVGTTLFVAIWNLIRKYEYVDSIKFTYLLILLIAAILTIQSIPLAFSENTVFGMVALVITIAFWVFFVILSGTDDYTAYEKERILSFGYKNTNFQLTKAMVKIFFFFGFSLLSLVLFVLIFQIIPLDSSLLRNEITLFFEDLQHFPSLLTNVWTWVIGIGCTIFPYILYFLSQKNWPARSLKWDQWVAILATLEPLASIFVGFFIGHEGVNFNLILLISAVILLAATIALRYYHESNCLKSIILLKVKQNRMQHLIPRLTHNPNIVELKTITGEFNIFLRTFFQSNHRLKNFIERLKELDSTLEILTLVEFEIKK